MIKHIYTENKINTLKKSSKYPKNSVGELMSSDYLSIRDNWLVKDVLSYIRNKGGGMIEIVYIVNKNNELIGDIKIGVFLFVSPYTKVSNLVNFNHISLYVTDTEEKAVKTFKTNNIFMLPVIDNNNILLGVVTIDDIFCVVNENYSEDIQKMGGMEVVINKPYLGVSLFSLIKKRVGWLVLLFIGEMLTSVVMQYFSNTLEKAIILSLFIPLVISSGGNSGSQAASLIIQAMALGDVKLKNWLRIMKREIICGFFLGIILGFLGFLRIFIWQSFNFYNYGPYWIFISMIVFFSLIGVVFLGTLVGSMLPILIKKLGGDPASSSTPFVATLVDVTGIVIYFFIAYLFLRNNVLH